MVSYAEGKTGQAFNSRPSPFRFAATEFEKYLICGCKKLVVGHRRMFQCGSFSKQYGENFMLLGVTQRIEASDNLFNWLGHVFKTAGAAATRVP